MMIHLILYYTNLLYLILCIYIYIYDASQKHIYQYIYIESSENEGQQSEHHPLETENHFLWPDFTGQEPNKKWLFQQLILLKQQGPQKKIKYNDTLVIGQKKLEETQLMFFLLHVDIVYVLLMHCFQYRYIYTITQTFDKYDLCLFTAINPKVRPRKHV